jgi:hypothetical protein
MPHFLRRIVARRPRYMGQRSALFHGGYSATAPLQYFSQLEFAGKLNGGASDSVTTGIAEFRQRLDDEKQPWFDRLHIAGELARQLEIRIGDLPAAPERYREWWQALVNGVETRFPMNRIDYYYFFYGRKLSEITYNAATVASLVKVRSRLGPAVNGEYRVEKHLRDCEFSLFKLVAPAALLASEPLHGYFSVQYRRMNDAFAPFRSVHLARLDAQGQQQLSERLDEFVSSLRAEYEKLKTLLVELGI